MLFRAIGGAQPHDRVGLSGSNTQVNAEQGANSRCFARAVSAEESERFPFPDVERQVVYHCGTSEVHPKMIDVNQWAYRIYCHDHYYTFLLVPERQVAYRCSLCYVAFLTGVEEANMSADAPRRPSGRGGPVGRPRDPTMDQTIFQATVDLLSTTGGSKTDESPPSGGPLAYGLLRRANTHASNTTSTPSPTTRPSR